tara:strand:+ start:2751 stop:3488 length:738 start_codon:yes stop_codon:yes gene_type:complete
MALDTTLDEVIKSLLIQQGETSEHKYMQYLDIAIRGLKELTFDILQQIKVANLDVNSNLTVDLPKDYVNYAKIGICKSDGRIHTLGFDEQICIANNMDCCGAPYSNGTREDENYSGNYRNGEETGGLYGLGGGQNKNGYYRIDREKNQIALSSGLDGNQLILEYLSDGSSVNGDMKVNAMAEESLRAYIYWKLIQRRNNIPLQEKESARRDFYNEKRLSRARIVNFTPDQARQITRKGFKQSPKF